MDLEMTVISCARCMTVFAIPEEMVVRLRENHQIFHCPMGHPQSYPAHTDLDVAKRKIDDLERIVMEQEKDLQRKARVRNGSAKQSASTPRRKAGDSKHGTTKTLKGGGKISRVTKP